MMSNILRVAVPDEGKVLRRGKAVVVLGWDEELLG